MLKSNLRLSFLLVIATLSLAPLATFGQDLIAKHTTTTFKPDRFARVTARPEAATETGAAMPARKAAPSPSSYDWSGAYIGANIGYGWARSDTKFDPLPSAASFINLMPTTLHPDGRGFTGGAQGGYNWQSGSFVGGFETSIAFSAIKGTEVISPIIQNNGTAFPGAGFLRASQDTDYLGTVRARAGGAWGRVLLYGTGGLAYGKVNYTAATDFRPAGTTLYAAAFSKTKTGWTVGFGTEYGINSHWTWKSEYLYIDLGNETLSVSPTPALPPFQVMYTWTNKYHTWNTGFNYRW